MPESYKKRGRRKGQTLRRIKLTPELSSMTDAERVSISKQSAVKTHPKYKMILNALREGLSPTEISRHLGTRGYLTMSESNFVKCVSEFKKKNKDLIAHGAGGELMDAYDLDAEFDGEQVDVDVVAELSRLIRLQKKRIGIEHKHEVNMQKLLDSTGKEVKLTGELLETLAQAKGLIGKGGGGRGIADDLPNDVSPDVREKLRAIKVDEANRERLYGLTQDFAKRAYAKEVETQTEA